LFVRACGDLMGAASAIGQLITFWPVQQFIPPRHREHLSWISTLQKENKKHRLCAWVQRPTINTRCRTQFLLSKSFAPCWPQRYQEHLCSDTIGFRRITRPIRLLLCGMVATPTKALLHLVADSLEVLVIPPATSPTPLSLPNHPLFSLCAAA